MEIWKLQKIRNKNGETYNLRKGEIEIKEFISNKPLDDPVFASFKTQLIKKEKRVLHAYLPRIEGQKIRNWSIYTSLIPIRLANTIG